MFNSNTKHRNQAKRQMGPNSDRFNKIRDRPAWHGRQPHHTYQLMEMSSVSKTRVASGGMTAPTRKRDQRVTGQRCLRDQNKTKLIGGDSLTSILHNRRKHAGRQPTTRHPPSLLSFLLLHTRKGNMTGQKKKKRKTTQKAAANAPAPRLP